MKVAVVTPYYKEEDGILRQCHESVLAQTVACDHILVADGFPNPIVAAWQAQHIILAKSHGDVGNTPRILGSISAFSLGYDAVAFLDADNWYHRDHVERMVALQQQTGATVCTATRAMYRPDGSYMFDDDKNDGITHVDSNCYFLMRPAMRVLLGWATMPKELAAISDTIYLASIKRAGLPRAHERKVTVCYRTTWESDFRRIGEVPVSSTKNLDITNKPFRWIGERSLSERRRIRHELGWPDGFGSAIGRRLRAAWASLLRRSVPRAGIQ